MTTAYLWHELKPAVSLDNQCQEIKSHIQSLTTTRNNMLLQEKKLRDTHTLLTEQLKACRKKIDMLDRDITAQQAVYKQKTTVLDSLQDPRQQAALAKELASKKAAIAAQEDMLYAHAEEEEELEKKIAQLLHDQKTTLTPAFHEKLHQLTDAIAAREAELAGLEKQWATQVESMPPELAAQYQQMKHRVANPAVPVINNSCSACFYALLGQDITALTPKTTIRCRNCYRYLYLALESLEQHDEE